MLAPAAAHAEAVEATIEPQDAIVQAGDKHPKHRSLKGDPLGATPRAIESRRHEET